MITEQKLNAPWTLHFERDGTEDIAIIRDGNDDELATSRHFWLGEATDPASPTLAAMQAMVAAPKLLKLAYSLRRFCSIQANLCSTASEAERLQFIRLVYQLMNSLGNEAIAEAEGTVDRDGSSGSVRPIVIEVRGGVVQEVRTVPAGVEYEIVDHDDQEEQDSTGEKAEPAFPPDPERMNAARARWADEAIKAFQKATGTDDEDILSDFLADLLHWSDRKNYDFEAAMYRARDHYGAETSQEGVTAVR